MRYQKFLVGASLPLILTFAACTGSNLSGSSSSGGGSTHQGGAGGGTGGGSISIPQAKSDLPRDPALPDTIADAVAANNAFAVNLFAQVRSTQGKGNMLTSPITASLALTMAYAGAKGETATEMASALQFGAAAASIFKGQNALTQALDGRAAAALAGDQQRAMLYGQDPPSPGDYQLQVINSVWGDPACTWEKPFLNVLAQQYGTGVNLVDFINDYEKARQTINGWVSAETAKKVNDLLPDESLSGDTRMVLVNAIHLKLPWLSPFPPSAPAKFTKTGGATVSTPFMDEMSLLPYVDDGQAQIVALPLAGQQLSVVIALPHGDLPTYEAGLAAGSAALAQPLGESMVSLSIPKFAFTSPTIMLKEELKAMGMVRAFDGEAADFTGLAQPTPQCMALHVDNVYQKAMVALQETGVEAAAATAVVVNAASSSGGPQMVNLVVDRPFLMAIVDAPTGAILFLGHVEDPTDPGSP